MRRSPLLTAIVALTLLAGACGDDEDDTTTAAQDSATTSSAPSEDDAPEDAPSGAPTVTLGRTDLGEILTDGEGRTLYLFTRDSPGESACTDACLDTWPPLEATDELVAGDGLDQAQLGEITRDDGTRQVTYASMPLYYYAADAEPGETNGQGVGDVWFVVSADGTALSSEAAATDPGY